MAQNNYSDLIRKALARSRAAVDTNKMAERAAAARLPASILSVADIADTLGDVLVARDRELIGHMNRLFKLTEQQKYPEDVRAKNLHARITQLESEVRMLNKKAAQR